MVDRHLPEVFPTLSFPEADGREDLLTKEASQLLFPISTGEKKKKHQAYYARRKKKTKPKSHSGLTNFSFLVVIQTPSFNLGEPE